MPVNSKQKVAVSPPRTRRGTVRLPPAQAPTSQGSGLLPRQVSLTAVGNSVDETSGVIPPTQTDVVPASRPNHAFIRFIEGLEGLVHSFKARALNQSHALSSTQGHVVGSSSAFSGFSPYQPPSTQASPPGFLPTSPGHTYSHPPPVQLTPELPSTSSVLFNQSSTTSASVFQGAQVASRPVAAIAQPQGAAAATVQGPSGSGVSVAVAEKRKRWPGQDQNAGPKVSGKEVQRKRSGKGKKKRRKDDSDDDDESGTSSSDDSDSSLGCYWGEGEDLGALPDWCLERRANFHRKQFGETLEWKDGALVEQVNTTDDVPGYHLSTKLRAKILNGEYVDIFKLVPTWIAMRRGKLKCRNGAPRAERSFANWLEGFYVFMGVVSMAYPKRAWHLVNYLKIVREVYALAGEDAAIAYDTEFRQNASHLSNTSSCASAPVHFREVPSEGN
ncbi:Hypothetical predicted protein [Podarcis lilfordi]|uniref:Uncharacterized protein n=1 Tax=Podarcis lilfordi TaxID=74358 RepID=A0AA35K091_9SAUR|nr:Hypothetical predicted protein [Podarcis lilfordi]